MLPAMPSFHAAWVVLAAVLTAGPAPESTPQDHEPPSKERPPRTCEGIRRVPAGEVRSGCDPERRAECLGEAVPSFEIDCGKVLRKAYQACVAQKACTPVPEQGDSPLLLGATYAQAETYCRWRQMRLPTEAEWERARAMEVIDDVHKSSAEWLDGWYTWVPNVTPAQRKQGYGSSRLLLTMHQDKSYRMGGDPNRHIPTVAFRCARGGAPRPPKPKAWPIPEPEGTLEP